MRRALGLIVSLAVILLLTIWRLRGPAPKTADAPPREFSSARAMEVLRDVLREEVPHPVGSAANGRVRERIVARFRAHGYPVRVQRRFACNAANLCATTENILAGTFAKNSVILTAHYDSVAAAPGASDDGMGVAALLESARALRGERFANPIAFLVTDGEEAGLLGAEAFSADPALLATAGVIVNVENRGTWGPSILFETSRGNRWLIDHAAGALRTPFTSSVFYTIYDLLPNDTDVTIFKRAGKAAVNFAAIRGVNWYHTPFDDLAHASPRTLQHHGENVLALARAFGAADLDARTSDNAVWFDVLGFFVIRWPAKWTIFLAVLPLLLLVVAARKTPPREITWGVVATFLAIVFAAIGGFALAKLALARSGGIAWIAHPTPAIGAMWLIGIGASLLAFSLFRERSNERALLLGSGMVWSVIGIALSLTLPGASFLFIVPALVVALSPRWPVACAVAAILFFPFGVILYEALGGILLAAVAVIIGINATLAAPFFASKRLATIAIVLACCSALLSLAYKPYSKEKPRQISLAYFDEGTQPLWVASGRLPGFARASESLPLWRRSSSRYTANAPQLRLPRVAIDALRDGEQLVVKLHSPRGANELLLVADSSEAISAIRINGIVPPPPPERMRARMRRNANSQFAFITGASEATIELTTRGRVDLAAMDLSDGLPPEGAAIAKMRGASLAFPAHDGDMTVTRATLVVK